MPHGPVYGIQPSQSTAVCGAMWSLALFHPLSTVPIYHLNYPLCGSPIELSGAILGPLANQEAPAAQETEACEPAVVALRALFVGPLHLKHMRSNITYSKSREFVGKQLRFTYTPVTTEIPCLDRQFSTSFALDNDR